MEIAVKNYKCKWSDMYAILIWLPATTETGNSPQRWSDAEYIWRHGVRDLVWLTPHEPYFDFLGLITSLWRLLPLVSLARDPRPLVCEDDWLSTFMAAVFDSFRDGGVSISSSGSFLFSSFRDMSAVLQFHCKWRQMEIQFIRKSMKNSKQHMSNKHWCIQLCNNMYKWKCSSGVYTVHVLDRVFCSVANIV